MTIAFAANQILYGGVDLSPWLNQIEMGASVEEVETTTMEDARTTGFKRMIGGLRTATASATGFGSFAAGASDVTVWNALSASATALTVAPTGVDGSVAYSMPTVALSQQTFGTIGEAHPISASFASSASGVGLARCTIIHPTSTARTSSGTGTAATLGTVSATQRVYAVAHCVAASGTTPSLTITLQRDDNAPFSSPTTAHTFSAFTSTGSQFTTIAGPITPDDRYRVTWTITGTTPSFTFLVAVGVI